jgi:hypothetical protein
MNRPQKIGEGLQGIVHRPPLNCNPPFIVNNPNDYISKVFRSEEHFKKEVEINEILKFIDPGEKYTLQIQHTCEENNNNKIIIYRYGGVSLGEILLDERIPTILLLIKFIDLIDYIYEMNVKYNFIHQDIGLGNILVDDNLKMYLIDFSYGNFKDIINYKNKKILGNNYKNIEKILQKIDKQDISASIQIIKMYFLNENYWIGDEGNRQEIKKYIDTFYDEWDKQMNYNMEIIPIFLQNFKDFLHKNFNIKNLEKFMKFKMTNENEQYRLGQQKREEEIQRKKIENGIKEEKERTKRQKNELQKMAKENILLINKNKKEKQERNIKLKKNRIERLKIFLDEKPLESLFNDSNINSTSLFSSEEISELEEELKMKDINNIMNLSNNLLEFLLKNPLVLNQLYPEEGGYRRKTRKTIKQKHKLSKKQTRRYK